MNREQAKKLVDTLEDFLGCFDDHRIASNLDNSIRMSCREELDVARQRLVEALVEAFGARG